MRQNTESVLQTLAKLLRKLSVNDSVKLKKRERRKNRKERLQKNNTPTDNN